MKAVVFRRHGGPEVLEYVDAPDPVVGPHEVLVRVKACALNHLDLWIRQGIPAYRLRLPHISGADIAGTIERLGAEVTGRRVGERVVLVPGMSCQRCEFCLKNEDSLCPSYQIRGAATDGGYAELVSASASDAFPMPPGVSVEQAAAYPLVFLTAWHMLMTRARLMRGESVLVQAGGSGVGHAAVQIAKHTGATVLATVGSDKKAAKAKALGADQVINYEREDFEQRVRDLTGGRGVDVVVEHVGPKTWERSVRCLVKGGRLVTCGSTTGPSVSLDLRYVFSRQLTILGSMMGGRAEFETVTRLLGQGALRPVVDAVFPLGEARAAQERLASRQVFGKLVLVP